MSENDKDSMRSSTQLLNGDLFIEESERSHSRGPLDGSLYAKINKNKKQEHVDTNHVTEQSFHEPSDSESKTQLSPNSPDTEEQEEASQKSPKVVVVGGNKIVYSPQPELDFDSHTISAPLAKLPEFSSHFSFASSRDSLPSQSSVTKESVSSSPTTVSSIKKVDAEEETLGVMETEGAIQNAAALIVDDVIKTSTLTSGEDEGTKSNARFSEISFCSATTLSSTTTEEEGKPHPELSDNDTSSEDSLSDFDALSPQTVKGRVSPEVLFEQALEEAAESNTALLGSANTEFAPVLDESEHSEEDRVAQPPPVAPPPAVPTNPVQLRPEEVISNGGFDKGPEYAVPMRDMKITTIPSKRAVLVSTGHESDDMAAQTSDRRDSVYDDGTAYNGTGYATIDEYDGNQPSVIQAKSPPMEEHSYIPEDVQELLNGLQDGPTISDIDSGFHGSSMALQQTKSPTDHTNVTSQSSSELSDPFGSPLPTQSNEPSPTYDGNYPIGKISPQDSPIQAVSMATNHFDQNLNTDLKVQGVATSTPTRKNLNPGIPIPTQTPPEPQPAKVQIITMRNVYTNEQGLPLHPSNGPIADLPVAKLSSPANAPSNLLLQQEVKKTPLAKDNSMVTMRTTTEPAQAATQSRAKNIESPGSQESVDMTMNHVTPVNMAIASPFLENDIEDQLDSENIKSVEEQIKHAQKHIEFLKDQQEKLVKRKQDRTKYRETLKRSSSNFERNSQGYNAAPGVTATLPRQPSKPEEENPISVPTRSQTLQRTASDATQLRQPTRNMPPITNVNQTVAASAAQQTPAQNAWNASAGPKLTRQAPDVNYDRSQPVQPSLPAKQVVRSKRNRDKDDIIMSSDLQEQLAELDKCIAELTTSMDIPTPADDSQPQSTQEPQVVLRQRSYTLDIERKMDPKIPQSNSNASSAPAPPTRSRSSFDSYRRLSQEFDLNVKRTSLTDPGGNDDVFTPGTQAQRKKKASPFPPQTSVTRRQQVAPVPPQKRRISLEERLSPGLVQAMALNPGAKPKEDIHSYKEDLAPEAADVPDTPTFPLTPSTPYVNSDSPAGRVKSPVGLAKTPLSALHLRPTEKPMESLHHVESPTPQEQPAAPPAQKQPTLQQEDVIDGKVPTPNRQQSPVQEPVIQPMMLIPNGYAKETPLLSDRSDTSSPKLPATQQPKETTQQPQLIMNGQNHVGYFQANNGLQPKVTEVAAETIHRQSKQSAPPNYLDLQRSNLTPTSLHGTPQQNVMHPEPTTPQQYLLNHSGASHSSHSHSPGPASSNSHPGSSDSLDEPSTRHSNSSILSSSSSSSAHHPGLPMTSPNNVRPGSQMSNYERHLLPPGLSGHRSGDESLGSPQSGRTSSSSISDIEKMNYDVSHATVSAAPKFIRDTTAYWYKPDIARDQALAILRSKPAGSFVVRDSRCFPGAFGLALKVDKLPPNVQAKPGADIANEYVRHFLIEPSSRGVKLKGCPNEPVFGSLSALVYQHSITALALPCRLIIPTADQEIPQSPSTPRPVQPETPPAATPAPTNTLAELLKQGAACNVIYIGSVDTESLTGPPAIERAIRETYQAAKANPNLTSIVHFKVSPQGITLTDSARKLFFRRHYPTDSVTFCGLDPLGGANKGQRRWDATTLRGGPEAWLFGFVARKQAGSRDNTCHVFAELDQAQPARAIVNFVMKILIGSTRQNSS